MPAAAADQSRGARVAAAAAADTFKVPYIVKTGSRPAGPDLLKTFYVPDHGRDRIKNGLNRVLSSFHKSFHT